MAGRLLLDQKTIDLARGLDASRAVAGFTEPCEVSGHVHLSTVLSETISNAIFHNKEETEEADEAYYRSLSYPTVEVLKENLKE